MFFLFYIKQVINSIILSTLMKPGERTSEEVGSLPAHEHLPASGDRSNADGHSSGAIDPQGPQAGHRRDHHHEREPARCPGLHV